MNIKKDVLMTYRYHYEVNITSNNTITRFRNNVKINTDEETIVSFRKKHSENICKFRISRKLSENFKNSFNPYFYGKLYKDELGWHLSGRF